MTIVEQMDRVLAPFDPDLVAWLMETFQGIGVRLKTCVTGIARNGNHFMVHARSNGEEQSIPADMVVHAAGRVPDLDPLDLPIAGVDAENGRPKLNEFLRSQTNPAVYAAGERRERDRRSPLSRLEMDALWPPTCFEVTTKSLTTAGYRAWLSTIPPIASVGLSEKQARDQGIQFRVQTEDTHDWYTARSVGESTYGFKVLIESGTDRILGAHLVGPHADEVINVFAMAIRNDLTSQDPEDTVFVYPTAASDIHYMI